MSAGPASNAPNEARERLREHFSHPLGTHNNHWDALWAKGDFLPWDRGTPNPALEDTLTDRQDLLGGPVETESENRRIALVPGCGKGYDVLLLASFGYDAYGLDVSENAIRACQRFAESEGGKYPARSEKVGRGQVQFLCGDFFKDEWLQEIGKGSNVTFDLIYDYTFLCALPPELRPAWSKRTVQLLNSTGCLICVEFPTYKIPSTGGPPFGLLPNVYLQHLTRPGEMLPYDEQGYVKDLPLEPNEIALERIAHWQPKRTHAVGQGTDWVSIWRHT